MNVQAQTEMYLSAVLGETVLSGDNTVNTNSSVSIHAPKQHNYQAPKLVAHRGYQDKYPENSLLSLRKAIESGAKFIEVDIQFSSDKHAVLYHDRNLKRISAQKGSIADYSLLELLSFSAHEPQRFGERYNTTKITPLYDLVTLLEQHPDVHCFVEIKRVSLQWRPLDEVVEQLCGILAHLPLQVSFISFSIEVIQCVKQQGWSSYGVVIEEWQQINSDTLATLNPDFVFTDMELLPAHGTLSIPHGQLVVYDVSDPAVAKKLQQRGLQFIETFAVGEMLQALNN